MQSHSQLNIPINISTTTLLGLVCTHVPSPKLTPITVHADMSSIFDVAEFKRQPGLFGLIEYKPKWVFSYKKNHNLPSCRFATLANTITAIADKDYEVNSWLSTLSIETINNPNLLVVHLQDHKTNPDPRNLLSLFVQLLDSVHHDTLSTARLGKFLKSFSRISSDIFEIAHYNSYYELVVLEVENKARLGPWTLKNNKKIETIFCLSDSLAHLALYGSSIKNLWSKIDKIGYRKFKNSGGYFWHIELNFKQMDKNFTELRQSLALLEIVHAYRVIYGYERAISTDFNRYLCLYSELLKSDPSGKSKISLSEYISLTGKEFVVSKCDVLCDLVAKINHERLGAKLPAIRLNEASDEKSSVKSNKRKMVPPQISQIAAQDLPIQTERLASPERTILPKQVIEPPPVKFYKPTQSYNLEPRQTQIEGKADSTSYYQPRSTVIPDPILSLNAYMSKVNSESASENNHAMPLLLCENLSARYDSHIWSQTEGDSEQSVGALEKYSLFSSPSLQSEQSISSVDLTRKNLAFKNGRAMSK